MPHCTDYCISKISGRAFECVKVNTYLFADDTNIFREIKTEEDRKYLQADLDKVSTMVRHLAS